MTTYTSYADLCVRNPNVMEEIKTFFGSHVYRDDNVICDPTKTPQDVAILRCNGAVVDVYRKADFEPAETTPCLTIALL